MRACFRCGIEITACFGFVKAGDFVDCLEGRRIEEPRELCERCAWTWGWTAAGDLVPANLMS